MDGTYPISIFNQGLIVAANGHQEQDDLDVVKNVDPLLPLRPLTADIEHSVGEAAKIENCLVDARRP